MNLSGETQEGNRATCNWDSTRAKIFFHICRIILGLVFILASIGKIARPWDFGRAIYAYEILNGYLISPFAAVIPWIELSAGLLVLFNKMTRPAVIVLGLINLTFIIAISSVMVRGMEIDCGCGLDVGYLSYIVGTQADGWALVRDFIFMGMAVVAYLGYNPKVET